MSTKDIKCFIVFKCESLKEDYNFISAVIVKFYRLQDGKSTWLRNLKIKDWEAASKLNDLGHTTIRGVAKVVDGTTGGFHIAKDLLHGSPVPAEGVMGLRRGTDWEAAVKASHEESKGIIQSRISKLEESSTVKGTGEGSKIENISKLTTEDIPTAKSGKFNDFFNSLSSAELDGLWKDKKIRKKIERQLREPGGLHEWHLVSRAPQFKFWDISAEKIKDLRTAISDVKFVNPKGVHGGLGSTKAHNELLAIIDTSNDYNTFIRRLNNWAYYRLEGGISSLPEGLRLK